jgi:hypothetical protein
VRPFLSDKYDLTKHPNYRLTADYDKKYWFDVEKYLNHRMTLRGDERYQVIMETAQQKNRQTWQFGSIRTNVSDLTGRSIRLEKEYGKFCACQG